MLKILLIALGILLLLFYMAFVGIVYVVANGKSSERPSLLRCCYLAAEEIIWSLKEYFIELLELLHRFRIKRK